MLVSVPRSIIMRAFVAILESHRPNLHLLIPSNSEVKARRTFVLTFVGAFTMSFGVSVGDIITVVQIAKNTVHNCRYAPSDFAEASRVAQSLYLMLEGVRNEYHNPDSPLHKDDRTRTDFAIQFKNCETSLKPLADLMAKYKSLGTPNIRLLDRMRFPKKEYLEYRGNLAFYTARLSEFLQFVGLGSLGRIEQKVDDLKENLPNLMSKIDQMCAEFRIMGDKESILSDHTNDEKFVWKAFRSKLNEAGFTSNVLREHEAAIFLRIRELTKCGLLDTDGSSTLQIDEEAPHSSSPIHTLPVRSRTMMASLESEPESEKVITPKPSIRNIGRRQPVDLGHSLRRKSSETGHSKQERVEQAESISSHLGNCSHKPRVWRNPSGEAILKGTFLDEVLREGQSFVTLADEEKQEVLIPRSNLSEVDLAYVNAFRQCAPDEMAQNFDQNSELLPHRTHPSILIGKRTQPKIIWTFRAEGSQLPRLAPYRSRSSLTNDLLPDAASSGDLGRVKRLLASGEPIESKGPESWTETIPGGENGDTTKRHSYPETTALYRAAHAGWLNIVHFLIKEGANVDTRNGYDGHSGDPILFDVISNGQEHMARLLLEYGAKMEAFGPRTALHVACSQPKRKLARLVLDYGASINAKDHLGQTPLYLASCDGFASIVEILLEEGARTNTVTSEGRSSLYKAGGNGRDDVVDLLLRYGADPAIGRGRLGETIIYKAAWYNDLKVVHLLLDFEADVNIRNDKKMKSYKGVKEKILHGLVGGLSNDRAIMNAWGKTALHAAAYRGYGDMVEMLLLAGADIEAEGNDALTPMYLAAQQKRKAVVQMLLKAGAKLETEKHDPVLALLDERNKVKDSKDKELTKRDDHRREMARLGTSDPLVGLVADMTKLWASSRRLKDPIDTKR